MFNSIESGNSFKLVSTTMYGYDFSLSLYTTFTLIIFLSSCFTTSILSISISSSFLSSSSVKQVAKFGGKINGLVPDEIVEDVIRKIKE